MFIVIAFENSRAAAELEDGFRTAPGCEGLRLVTVRAGSADGVPMFEPRPDAVILESEAVTKNAVRMFGPLMRDQVPFVLLGDSPKVRDRAAALGLNGTTLFVDRARAFADAAAFAAAVHAYLRLKPASAVFES